MPDEVTGVNPHCLYRSAASRVDQDQEPGAPGDRARDADRLEQAAAGKGGAGRETRSPQE